MQFETLKAMLKSADDREFLDSLAKNSMTMPYLVEKTLQIINDSNRAISPKYRVSFFNMCKEYFKACFVAYLDQSAPSNKLERLISGATSTTYYTTTINTDRVATANEVKNGIAELRPVVTHNVEPNVVQLLNIMLWSFNGLVRYYTRAGLEVHYDEQGLVESHYQLLLNGMNKIKELVDWMNIPGNYDKTIAVLRASLKAERNYKYPTFASDEIQPDISVKQVIYKCKSGIRGRGASDTQFKALQILGKMQRNTRASPSPGEISILRQAYAEIESGLVNPSGVELPSDVEEVCKFIEDALERGYISEQDFAVRVERTVRQRIKCSDKQLGVLLNARERIAKRMNNNKTDEDSKNKTDDSADDSGSTELQDMYNALGSGVLEI